MLSWITIIMNTCVCVGSELMRAHNFFESQIHDIICDLDAETLIHILDSYFTMTIDESVMSKSWIWVSSDENRDMISAITKV